MRHEASMCSGTVDGVILWEIRVICRGEAPGCPGKGSIAIQVVYGYLAMCAIIVHNS